MNHSIGSIWRKWDLHLHTNASDGKGTCQEILDEAKAKSISCIAVTDHHTVDNVDEMKRLALPMGISVISGVEFRTEYGKESVHMIGLFPDYKGKIQLTAEYLRENVLNKLGLTRTSIIQKAKEEWPDKGYSDDKYFKEGVFLVQVEFKKAADIIHELGGLVTVHAGNKDNGIEKEMKHDGISPRNTTIENSLGSLKKELFEEGYIDICDISRSKDATFYLEKYARPSIITSDAHEVKDVGSKYVWIKANTTLEGLRQVLAEPNRISFDEPDLLSRIRKSPDKFIKKLEINKTAVATMPEVWFDKIGIDINPGLVAIIGNKGSGKSAIADILALCSDSSNQSWAFLTNEKFRMAKPFNRSKQIEASIEWADNSHSITKTLDKDSDTTQPERVKYIPQNFLESLCTTENDRDFEIELKKIIFQYLEPSQRYGLNDLDSIIQYLSSENSRSCNDLKDRIKTVNSAIIKLEEMQEPEYRAKLANELKYKQEQLSNAQGAKPVEVKKPDLTGDIEAQKAKIGIDALLNDIELLKAEIEKEQVLLSENIKKKQELLSAKERLGRLINQIDEAQLQLKPIFEISGIDPKSVLDYTYNESVLTAAVSAQDKLILTSKNKLDESKDDSIAKQYADKQKELKTARTKMSEPERKYQDYLRQKQEWEKKIEDITGSPDKEGSIKYLQTSIGYIDRTLQSDLYTQKNIRKDLVEQLMKKKSEVLETYNTLFAPIVQFIETYREDLRDYPIEFDATFTISDFSEHFFDFVSQQASGSFCGREQGMERIRNLIENIDIGSVDSVVNFAMQVNDALQTDLRDGSGNAPKNISSQIKKGHSPQEVYDYIYSMDYVLPFFQLKMNGKPLSSLSPGERGALLLLLYLFIDMDDKPLIIDQPEENLDNESVFRYLVHFIKEAKKKRQIIIVTHNPNLAVVCDADQIIRMNIDKQHGNVVSFDSGAIEDPIINKHVVDILEGTYPAFHNRDCKYMEKTI